MTPSPPRLVAWEITRSCNLHCAHCRASAKHGPYDGELSTKECFRLVDGIAEVGNPILILTGGEPLLRTDFFDIARYAAGKGLRVTVGTNGTILDDGTAARLKSVPISRVGISLDFPSRALQDEFRGLPGAFDDALRGIEAARRAGVEVQINSTITRLNAPYLADLLTLALELGAVAFHPFLLVPTGRGKELEDQELPPEEYERILNWIYDRQIELKDRIFFKPTDAPHYMRVAMQRAKAGGVMPAFHPGAAGHPGGHPGGPPGMKAMGRGPLGGIMKTVMRWRMGGRGGAAGRPGRYPGGHPSMNAMSRGCLAGIGFCFISHVGRVQGCGYLDVEAGNVKRQSFSEVWRDSPLFNQLRDYSLLKGKCGVCEFKKVCGGCRARAYEATGDCLQEEPYCVYQPKRVTSPRGGHSSTVLSEKAGIQGQQPPGT